MARIGENIRSFSSMVASVVIQGSLFGYLYGRLAHLPAIPIAKAFTIWEIARVALFSFVNVLNLNYSAKKLLNSAVIITTATLAIQEMQKRNLLGHKMKIFLIASATFEVALHLLFAWKPHLEDKIEEALENPGKLHEDLISFFSRIF